MANNPTDTYSQPVAVWNWSGAVGADISNKGRDFTSVSGITAGVLDTIGAGVFAAGSYARQVNPTFLSLNNLSFELIIQPTAITANAFVLRVGSTTATSTFGVAIRILSSGGNFYWSMLKRGLFGADIAQQVTDATNLPITFGQLYHLVCVAESGANNRIFVYGTEAATVSVNNRVSDGLLLGAGGLSGPIQILSGWELAIGDPSTTQPGFVGTLGRVVAHPYAMTLNQAGFNSRLQLDQDRVVGLGGESAAGTTNRGPVAVPHIAGPITGDGTATIDIDVAGRSFDANGGVLTALVSTGERLPSSALPPPLRGTSLITAANRLQYKPTGTTVDVIDTVPFNVRDPSSLISKPSIVRCSVLGFSPPDDEDWICGDAHHTGPITALTGNQRIFLSDRPEVDATEPFRRILGTNRVNGAVFMAGIQSGAARELRDDNGNITRQEIPWNHSAAGLNAHAATAWNFFKSDRARRHNATCMYWDIEANISSINVPASVGYTRRTGDGRPNTYDIDNPRLFRDESIRFAKTIYLECIRLARAEGANYFECGSYNHPNASSFSNFNDLDRYTTQATELDSPLLCPALAFGGSACYFSPGRDRLANLRPVQDLIDFCVNHRRTQMRRFRAAFPRPQKLIPSIFGYWVSVSPPLPLSEHPGGTNVVPAGAMKQMIDAILEEGADGLFLYVPESGGEITGPDGVARYEEAANAILDSDYTWVTRPLTVPPIP